MKFSLLCSSAVLIAASSVCHAAVIEHNGYTRDEASNIVKGGGYEWLMWSETNGMSVNDALTAFAASQWGVAQSAQVVSLYNAFNFGLTFVDDGSTQIASNSWTPSYSDATDWFIKLFGITYSAGSGCQTTTEVNCYNPDDLIQYTQALFERPNGSYNMAYVDSDSSVFVSDGNGGRLTVPAYGSIASLTNATYNDPTVAYQRTAIMLVRRASTSPTHPIPVPATITILPLAALLLYRRRTMIS